MHIPEYYTSAYLRQEFQSKDVLKRHRSKDALKQWQPEIFALIQVDARVPVTHASVERAFSQRKFVLCEQPSHNPDSMVRPNLGRSPSEGIGANHSRSIIIIMRGTLNEGLLLRSGSLP